MAILVKAATIAGVTNKLWRIEWYVRVLEDWEAAQD